MESLIVLCFLSSPTLYPLWTSISLVFRIFPPNPNFNSLLHWKNFLIESSITLFLVLKKTKIHTKTQSYQLPKPPHCKNGTWDLCLIDLPPLVIYDDKCWKWNLHFVVINGWNGTEVLVLNWMQVMPHGNVGHQFSILH
jgi:hypothetical protein